MRDGHKCKRSTYIERDIPWDFDWALAANLCEAHMSTGFLEGQVILAPGDKA